MISLAKAYEEVTIDEQKTGYGKRPIWQWILIYLVVGGIIYLGIYYFVLSDRGGYGADVTPNQSNPQNQT